MERQKQLEVLELAEELKQDQANRIKIEKK